MGSPSFPITTSDSSQPVNVLRDGYYPAEHGRLVSLPTKIESQSSCHPIDVFVATIPLKSANTVLKLTQAAIQDATTENLQHLRRFVKPEHLPTCLSDLGKIPFLLDPVTKPTASPNSLGVNNETEPNDHQSVATLTVNGPTEASQQTVLHYLVCPTSIITSEDLHTIFSSVESSLGSNSESYIRVIPVPLNPPSSENQAKDWSRRYWPTVYKGGNPYGPHPVLVARASEDVRSRAGRYMDLARRAGKEISLAAQGEPIGAVIVNRSEGEDAFVVVAAGDARWRNIGKAEEQGNGNVTAHAVMRAIGMVARKRRSPLHMGLTGEPDFEESDLFADRPLTPLEMDVYTSSTVARDGYLCLDLELYVTHEPCVMCSMAILHSRFSKVIFGQRMLRTGGITVESRNDCDSDIKNDGQGLGYGLFWRQELNWRYLAWQWVADDERQALTTCQEICA